MKNRRIYLNKDVYDMLRIREQHIEDGIEDDPLLSSSFDKNFNRKVFKSITRFLEFLKTAEDKELDKYLKTSENITNLSKTYDSLMSYNVNELYSLYFITNKRLFGSEEYKVLFVLKYNLLPDLTTIKEKSENVHEWSREYVLNETQMTISKETGYNIVLGAAGTGKTDVAIHSYLNSLDLDNASKIDLRDIAFITYSPKLADYVSYEIDIMINDNKIKFNHNVYKTDDFFLAVLAKANINIEGYKIINGKYVLDSVKKPTDEDTLNNHLANISTFIDWKNKGYVGLNKNYIQALDKLIETYGIDYPYLFFRGIYKGKVINKASEKEIVDYLARELKLTKTKVNMLLSVLNDYVEFTEEPSEVTFSVWYDRFSKKYKETFKQLEKYSEESDLYKAFNKYYDFANPVRENKHAIENLNLFIRETSLIEGYRGQTRDNFEEDAKLLYEVCSQFAAYQQTLNLYDDNDLAYLITENIDTITAKGIYKTIIVDEFQDLTERQIHSLIRLNYNGLGKGVIHFFGDFEQTINPTFIQYENLETLFMVNGIEDYKKQILNSTYRYSDAICKELEALRKKGQDLFGLEDLANYVPLTSNKAYAFETNGNLVIDSKISEKMLNKITTSKNDNIMYVVSDNASKEEFIKKYNVLSKDVYTVNESKGRESEFVVVYNLCTSSAKEYENIFSDNLNYSRAARIFYNRLYVGITRCKTNFLQIEDGSKLGPNTTDALMNLIQPLLEDNVDIFLEEMLSNKVNYYFRALESFKNLDFVSVSENLTFYSAEDYYYLKDIVKNINIYNESKENEDVLIEYANKLKVKSRIDLARIIYIVLDKTNMLKMMDIREGNNYTYTDTLISQIVKNDYKCLDNIDLEAINKLGYFSRKKESLINKINSLKIEVIK